MRGVLLSLCLAAGWAATAAGARVRTVSQGVGEPGVPPPQQGGHTNPYCLTCRQIFNQWNENQEMSLDDICGAFPEGKVQQCRVVGKALHGNRDVKTLLNNGCLDKTKKLSFNEVNATYYSMGAEDPRMRAGGECPGVLACNIIESVAGGPMCGSRLRAWGDFLKEGTPWRRPTARGGPGSGAPGADPFAAILACLRPDSLERPIRPSPYDTFPQEDGVRGSPHCRRESAPWGAPRRCCLGSDPAPCPSRPCPTRCRGTPPTSGTRSATCASVRGSCGPGAGSGRA